MKTPRVRPRSAPSRSPPRRRSPPRDVAEEDASRLRRHALRRRRPGARRELGVADGGVDPRPTTSSSWSSLAQDGTTAGGVIRTHRERESQDEPRPDVTTSRRGSLVVLVARRGSRILNVLHLGVLAGRRLDAREPASEPRIRARLQPADAPDARRRCTRSTRTANDVCANAVGPVGHLVGGGSVAQARYALDLPRRDDRSVADRGQCTTCPTSSAPAAPRRSRRDSARRLRVSVAASSTGPAARSSRASPTSRPDSSTSSGSTYPTDLGQPSLDNTTWLRRRIPVVGIA